MSYFFLFKQHIVLAIGCVATQLVFAIVAASLKTTVRSLFYLIPYFDNVCQFLYSVRNTIMCKMSKS